jgi:hypothetical protein
VSVTGQIVRTTLLQVLRRPRGTTARGRLGGIISSLIVYIFAGFVVGTSLSRGLDTFTAGFLAGTFFLFLYAIFVVMEFSTIVTGPEDLAFYTPLPVSPRSYVAAKIMVTALFGVAFAVAFSLPSFVLAPRQAPGILLELLDASLVSGLGMVTLLGLLSRFIAARHLREVAAWAQFVVFIAIYGGFFLVQRSMGAAALHVGLTGLLLLVPSSWVAAAVSPGSGLLGVLGAGLAVAVPAALFAAGVHVISAAYDGKIAEMEATTPRAHGRQRMAGRAGLLWRTPEERAMALLIANLFRHDTQFRMGILTIIPVTVLYFVIILFASRSAIADPFTAAGRAGFGQTILLYLAIGFFPTYMKSALTYSSQAEATWLFSVSPADRLLFLRASRRFILTFFVAPYVTLMAVLYAALTGALWHTVMHFAVITLLVLLEVDVLLLYFPRMPFSRLTAAGRRGGAILMRTLVGFLILLPLSLLVAFVYPFTAGYAAAVAVLAALVVTVRITGGRFAARKLAMEEFSG